MAVLMDHTAPNGAKGNYFRINRIEGICSPREPYSYWMVWVGFYASQDIRAQNTDPIFNYQVNIAMSDMPLDPKNGTLAGFYSAIKNYAPFVGNVVTDMIEDSPDISLDAAKANKVSEINNARLVANTKYFNYNDKQIACDTLSRSDIDGTNGYVSLMGTFPDGWVGQWKTVDNTYIPIATIDDWKAFYAAMVAQGQANFLYAQGLKKLVADATDVQQVAAVYWGMQLPGAESSASIVEV